MGLELRIGWNPVWISFPCLPQGPDYLIMAITFTAHHSGPGPKADVPFIREMAAKLENAPGKHWIAFSMGGLTGVQTGAFLHYAAGAMLLEQKATQKTQRDRASARCILTIPMKRAFPIPWVCRRADAGGVDCRAGGFGLQYCAVVFGRELPPGLSRYLMPAFDTVRRKFAIE